MHTYPIPYHSNSADIFALISDMPFKAWLDSNTAIGQSHDRHGRFDILCAAPSSYFKVFPNHIELIQGTKKQQLSGCPFELIQQYINELPKPHKNHLPFCGGLLGYFSYELGLSLNVNKIEKKANKNSLKLPLLCAGIYHWAVIQDHQKQESVLACLETVSEELTQSLLQTLRVPPQNKQSPDSFSCGNFKADISQQQYLDKLQSINNYIQAGDCYQVNFSQRFSAEFSGDASHAYCHLRQQLPSPYSAFLQLDQGAVLSHSPERFIRLRGNKISTKPIKGTSPRFADDQRDKDSADELQNSVKNRAENLMIVDLMRNDLSRSSELGSVQVPELFALESYRNVHHLVSTVNANLAADCTPLMLMQNSFPGGSITGAPKRRAMEIIEELELSERSVYCGSIVYISACGNMDSSIAIRTLVADGQGQIHCWGGGGIVADSEPEAEYQESLTKVRILMDSLRAGAQ